MPPPRIWPCLALRLWPLLLLPPLSAGELVLTDPGYGKTNASGLDQPRLYALVSDPAAGGAFRTWFNPTSGVVEPVLLTVFVDTGASGFAISRLNASGELEQANLAFAAGDYVGAFTEIGIGGEELGDVTRPFGIWLRNGPIGASEEISPAEFFPGGDFGLWVRREVGAAEVNQSLGFPLISPLNLVGMPVIRQRRLLLDPTPLADLGGGLVTELLPPAAPEPETQATVPLVLRDFIAETPPPGEVLPSHEANPLVPGLTLSHGGASASGEWLLDTGAGSSFASFAMAKACGLIPAAYATMEDFMAEHSGRTVEVGGIGASLVVPILTVDRVSVATREGATLVWENVDLLIADVAGLDGIFGMNLLVPAVTVDPADPLGSLFDVSPGAFTRVVIDTTNATDPVMRLATPYAAGTVYGWLGATFSAAERSDPALGSLGADPDGDGLANLLEYALGLDPRSVDAAGAIAVGRARGEGGDAFLTLEFTRPSGGRAGAVYHVEVSENLQSWRRGDPELALHATIAAGERETLVYRAPLPAGPGGRRFLRLVVETSR